MNNLDQTIIVDNKTKLIPLNSFHSSTIKKLYSDKKNVRYMGDVIRNWQGDENKALKTINIIKSSKSDFIWVINYNSQNIGIIGLENIQNFTGEIWFLLDKTFQGKGIVKTSAIKLFEFLKLNYWKEIFAYVKTKNIISIKLLEKLNFKEENSNIKEKLKYYLELD